MPECGLPAPPAPSRKGEGRMGSLPASRRKAACAALSLPSPLRGGVGGDSIDRCNLALPAEQLLQDIVHGLAVLTVVLPGWGRIGRWRVRLRRYRCWDIAAAAGTLQPLLDQVADRLAKRAAGRARSSAAPGSAAGLPTG